MRKQMKRTAAAVTALVLAVSLLGSTALTAAAEEVPTGPAPTEAQQEESPPADAAKTTEEPAQTAPTATEPTPLPVEETSAGTAEATAAPAPEATDIPAVSAETPVPEESAPPEETETEPTPAPMTTEAPTAAPQATEPPTPEQPDPTPTEAAAPVTGQPTAQPPAPASQSIAAPTATPAEAPSPAPATPETAAPAVPTPTPAPTQQTLTAALFSDIDCTNPLSDGTVITLEGLLPAGGSVRAVPVEASLQDEEQEVLAAYDITVLDAAGEEWQPQDSESIGVSITAPALTEAVLTPEQAEPQAAAPTISIYHVDGGNTPATIEGDSAGASIVASDVTVPDGENPVRFTAEGFSVYLLTLYRPARCELRVTNETTGNMRDPDLGFVFTVTVNGNATDFTLKDGKSCALKLRVGDKVTVSVAAQALGYVTSVNDGYGILVGNSYGFTVTSCSRDVNLVFTNNRELSPPTGLSADAAPYAAIVLLGLCAAAMLCTGRGRKKVR